MSRLLPRFKRLPVAPDGSRWLLLMQTHAVCGSQWLPMAPIDFHRLSLLPYHYPKRACEQRVGQLEAELASLSGGQSGMASALATAEHSVTTLKEELAAVGALRGQLEAQVAALTVAGQQV